MKRKIFLVLGLFLSVFSYSETAKEMRDNFITAARSYLGVPYVYGGRSTSGMDCSGFVYCSGVKAGLTSKVAENSKLLYQKSTKIEPSEREAGDLIFFSENGSSVSHVAIFLGSGKMIHSASSGRKTGVIISSISESYWKKTYFASGRILPAVKSSSGATGSSGGNKTSSGGKKTSSGAKNKSSETLFNPGYPAGKYFSFDASIFADWSFFDASSVNFYMKGVSVQAELRTTCWKYNPGLLVRYSYLNREGEKFLFGDNNGVNIVPLCFEWNFNDYVAAYTGAVLSTGITCSKDAKLHGSEKEMQAGIYPGIFGIMFRTPQINCGGTRMSLVQDISWSYFKASGGYKDFDFAEGFAAGMTFSTGIRFTFPF